jgi:hypothetical protein
MGILKRLRRRFIQFLLISTIFLSPFLVTEVIVAQFFPQYRRDYLAYHQDDYLWSSGVSGKYYSTYGDEGYSNLLFNDKAERGKESVSFTKPAMTFRVLLLGDSMTFGSHLSQEHIWAEKIKKKLGSAFPLLNIEVINCAVPATNIIDLYYIWVKRCSAYEKVDWLVLQTTLMSNVSSVSLFSGEVLGRSHNILAFLHQYYSYYDPEYIKHLAPRIKRDEFGLIQFEPTHEEIDIYKNAFRPLTFLYDYSHFVRLIEHRLVWPYRLRFTYNISQLDYSPQAFEKYSEVLVGLGEAGLPKIPTMDFSLNILSVWKSKLFLTNTELLVLNLPNSLGLDLNESYHKRQSNDQGKEQDDYLLKTREHYSKFLTKLNKLAIEYLDLLPILSDCEVETYFIPGDVHFNPAGHDIVADQLTRRLVESGKN